jgi:hypothetical protein
LQLPSARKQLRIPDSKVEISDSISKIFVAKFKIGVAMFSILDSAVENTVGWTVRPFPRRSGVRSALRLRSRSGRIPELRRPSCSAYTGGASPARIGLLQREGADWNR